MPSLSSVLQTAGTTHEDTLMRAHFPHPLPQEMACGFLEVSSLRVQHSSAAKEIRVFNKRLSFKHQERGRLELA